MRACRLCAGADGVDVVVVVINRASNDCNSVADLVVECRAVGVDVEICDVWVVVVNGGADYGECCCGGRVQFECCAR